MCGIAGEISFNNHCNSHSRVGKAVDLLQRRGPDDRGLWTEDNVCLGHRRLAILDISPAGHQPMISENERYVVVYNGEIYNFIELRNQLKEKKRKWMSQSDTEVLLAAYENWGVDCLNHFHGMFAFAIWDRSEKTLFAARDRLGVKPFYYHFSTKAFIFSSRPRVLFAIEPELSGDIDRQALRLYLEGGYIPAPYSFHAAIRKLPPAHYLMLKGSKLKIVRYWNFAEILPEASWKNRVENDLIDELEEIVANSVRMRLVSDVPLGAFLSGGVDSSLVVALMAKYNNKSIKTFTIGFNDKAFDESQYAEAVAKRINAEHYCEFLNIDDLLYLNQRFNEEFDEPFFDSSAFPTMAVSKLTRHFVTVSLSGDGGDELFGGYHYYNIVRYLSLVYHLPISVRKALANFLRILPKHKIKLLSHAIRQPDKTAMIASIRSIAKDFGDVLGQDALGCTFGLSDLFAKEAKILPKSLSASEQMMRLDAMLTLPDDYLQKVDVSSMAYSLEMREPLLDHKLVEWAMKLPHTWKIKNGTNKYLLRKLAYRYIPRELLDRPKKGFEVPIAKWLRGPLKKWAQERIEDKPTIDSLMLNQNAVRNLWKQHTSGAREAHPLLWAILMVINFQNSFAFR